MATTTNYSWSTPDDTALVKDGAAAIRSLGTAIDSTVFTNAGNAIAKTIVDAKGDLIVATAADTVARLASSASNGDLLTVDTSTASGLKWAAGGGDFTHIATTTFSASSAVNVNDVFSATYSYYVIKLDLVGSANTGLSLRYRVSGSDDTTANYNAQRITAYGGTVDGSRATNATSHGLDYVTTNGDYYSMEVFNPFETVKTGLLSKGVNDTATCEFRTNGYAFNATTSFTGFSIFPATGNITGTLRVYGLANS